MKKVLAINFSQSGQLDEIVNNFISPLQNVTIDRIKIEPTSMFPFPWSEGTFYNAMPETVLEEPMELKPINYKEEKYDLIILGYQPWFLSPSRPTTSLLKSEAFMKLLKDTPVITIIGARNMWLNAQESVVNLVNAAGGKMVGNIALVDRAPNHLSAVSIVYWMMTGKKERKWGVFPLPGVSDDDISGCSAFGAALNVELNKNDLSDFQKKMMLQQAVRINTNILFIEGKAKKIFRIWANLIKKKEASGKNRIFWIKFFRIYLNVALFGVAPILLVFYNVLIRPFKGKKIAAKKKYFSFLGMKEDSN